MPLESDLILKVDSELGNKISEASTTAINSQKDMKISLKVEANLDKRERLEDVLKKFESKENIAPAPNTNNQVSIDLAKKVKNRKVTNEKFLEMETLPEPPPTPPESKNPAVQLKFQSLLSYQQNPCPCQAVQTTNLKTSQTVQATTPWRAPWIPQSAWGMTGRKAETGLVLYRTGKSNLQTIQLVRSHHLALSPPWFQPGM